MTLTFDFVSRLIDLNEAAYSMCQSGNFSLKGYKLRPIQVCANRPLILYGDPLSYWGFVAEDGQGQQYVVFRGTQDENTKGVFLQEWATDLFALPLAGWVSGGHVHRGFLEAYLAVAASVVSGGISPSAIVTGHSLGAAIATLCALHQVTPNTLVTFAGPRVGDAAFAASLVGSYRVVNPPDLVPRVPLPVNGFEHGGTLVTVNGLGSVFSPIVAHSLDAYRAGAVSTLGRA